MRPPHAPAPRSQADDQPAAPFPHQVLVHGPATVNVPTFALAIERHRFETEVRMLTSYSAARAAVGRRAALALKGREFGPFQVVHRRQRLARQSVTYSVWLAFATQDDADRYRVTFPASR